MLEQWARSEETLEHFEDRVSVRSRMTVAEATSLCQQFGVQLEHSRFGKVPGEAWMRRPQCRVRAPQYPGGTGTLVAHPYREPGAFFFCVPVVHQNYVDPVVVFHDLGHWLLTNSRQDLARELLDRTNPGVLEENIQEAYACALAVALAHTAGRLSWCRPQLFRRVFNLHRSPAYVADRDIRDLLKNFFYQHLDDFLVGETAYPLDPVRPTERCLRFLDYLVLDLRKFLALHNLPKIPSVQRTALDVWMGNARGWPGVDPVTGVVTDLTAALAEQAKNTVDMPQLELLRHVRDWLRLPQPWRRKFVWNYPPVAEFLQVWVYDFGFFGLVEDARLLVRPHGPQELIATLDQLVDHVAVFRHFH